jgi:molybdopterin/thiamine biosynthesis adenylyltransferase
MSPNKLFERIDRLFDIGLMGQANVLIAGCGSGGGNVALQLVMSGIRNFSLYDNDVVAEENVIRHVCGLRYLGWRKVDAVADVLRDRNLEVQVELNDLDLMALPDLDERVRKATVVVLATDKEASRYRINQACVTTGTPMVVGRVFTRGIGGEAFVYRPGQGGCLACLEQTLERSKFREGIREIDLVSAEERDAMYGLPVSEIKDSPGLNVDISFITCFHTRLVLDAIADRLPERPKSMEPIPHNYFIWGNRPVHPFEKHFQIQRLPMAARPDCKVCGTETVS